MEDLYKIFDSFFGEWMDDTSIETVLLVDHFGIPKRKLSRVNFDRDEVISAIGSSLFRPTVVGLNEATVDANEIFIKAPRGYIVFYKLTDELYLGIISGPDCKIGLLQILIHSFSKKVHSLLTELSRN